MPFTKITSGKNRGKYHSPSGRVFTAAQVKLYYSRGGTFKKKRRVRRRTITMRRRRRRR